MKVKDRLREFGLHEGSRLSLAYSGGPDSTALLHVLAELRKRMKLRLRALFVDHGIRSRCERAAEDALVIRTAYALEIPLICLYLPEGFIAGRAKKYGGTEAAARGLRYRFFEECAVDEEDVVLLAHTLDDQMETQIMRFFQGSGPAGLAGIPERRGPFLRPLLSVTKAELYRYLEEIGAKYSIDSSNRTGNFLRNRVRTELMPAARSVFPGMERALSELADKMRSQKTASGALDFIVEERGCVSFDADAFAAAPDTQRRDLLYRLWDHLNAEEPRRLPYRFLREFFRSFDDMYNEREHGEVQKAGVRPLTEGHGIRVELRGRRIFCRTNVVREQKKSYLTVIEEGAVEMGNETRIFVQCGTLDEAEADEPERIGLERVELERLELERVGPESSESAELYSSPDFGPCVLRSRRAGDSIRLTEGELKIKELMERLRIPSESRWCYPLVEDRRGILAVLNPERLSSSVIGVLGSEMPENGLRYRFSSRPYWRTR